MGRPGGPGPLDPIFDVQTQFGAIAVGDQPAGGVITVTVEEQPGQDDPVVAENVFYDVVFSESVIGFASGDMSLGGTAGATSVLLTGGPSSYVAEVSGMTDEGTVTARVRAGTVTGSVSGDTNRASTSIDNVINWEPLPITFGAWAYSSGAGVSPGSTLFWPSAPAAGDVALIFGTRSNNVAWPTLPDFGAPLHEGARGVVYSHLCTGAEAASYSVILGSSARHTSIIVLIKNLAGLTERGWATQGAASTPTDITYPTITPTGQPTLVFYTAHDSQTTFVPPSTLVNPGGSNPIPLDLADSGSNPPTSDTTRCVIWYGQCTSTSPLGDRTQPNTGLGPNFYHGMTFAIDRTIA